MSDKCGFPSFKEAVQGEASMWGDVFHMKYGVKETLKEAGFAVLFAAGWAPIAGLNKVLGCPPGSNGKSLDLSEPPVPGYDR